MSDVDYGAIVQDLPPEAEAEAPEEKNPYLGIVQQMNDDQEARLRNSVSIANGRDSERARRALSVGLDPETDETNLAEGELRKRMASLPLDGVRVSGALTRLYDGSSNGLDAASAAFDDMNQFVGMSTALKKKPAASFMAVQKANYKRGDAMVDRGVAASELIWNENEQTLAEFERRDAILDASVIPEGTAGAEFIGNASQMAPLLIEEGIAGAQGFAVAGTAAAATAFALGQLGPQVATPEEPFTMGAAFLTMGAAGGKAAAAYKMFQIEGGNWYGDYLKNPPLDENGQPLDPWMGKGMAILVGSLNAGLEFVGGASVLRLIPGGREILNAGTKSGVARAAREALKTSGSMRELMKRLGKDYAKALVTEPTTEFVQSIVSSTASNFMSEHARTKIPGGDSFSFKELIPSGQQATEALHEAWAALQATATIGMAGSIGTGVKDVSQGYLRSRHDIVRLEAAETMAVESRLRKSNPEIFEETVNEIGAESDAKTVYVHINAINAAVEAGDLDVSKLSADTQRQIKEAQATGGDVEISLGEYVTRVSDNARGSHLRQHAKLTIDGLTRAQADAVQDLFDGLGELDDKGAEGRPADDQPGQKLFERFQKQLMDAGMSAEEALHNAKVMRAFAVTNAKMLGVEDPDSLLDAVKVEGEAADQTIAGEKTLWQPLSVPPSIPPRFRKLTAAFLRGDQSIDEFLFTAMPKAIMFRGDISVAENMEEMHQSIAARLGLNPDLDLDGILPVIRDVDSDEVIERGYLDRDSGEFIPAAEFDAVANTLGNLAAQKTQTLGQPQDQSAPSTGDATDQAVSAFNRGVRKLFAPGKNKAHHGSPFDFDKFDLTKIGTGEGAQAFGWGMYFASRRGIAEFYRETLSVSTGSGPEGLASRTLLAVDGSREAAVAELRTRLAVSERADPGDRVARDFQQKAREAIRMIEAGEVTPGQLFEVELPGDENLLDWDKPMSEQDSAVLEKLQPLIAEHEAAVATQALDSSGSTRAGIGLSDVRDGSEFYNRLSEAVGGERAASEALASVGILGHKYLDNTSRGEGEVTHNYVIYDDMAINVVKKFYSESATGASAPRGSITFDAQMRDVVIRLLAARDRSTFLHEAVHLFVEIIGKASEADDAPPQLKADMQKLLRFLGVNSFAEVTRKHHEKLARAGEAYFREGKAPSPDLISAFATFRSWLRQVYQTLKGLNVELDDDIRSWFDSILATPSQIEAMKRLTEKQRIELATAQSKLDAARIARIALEQSKARDAGDERLKARKKKQRDLTKSLRPEVEKEVANQPIWRLREWLTRGQLTIEEDLRRLGDLPHQKLDRVELIQRFGEAVVADLPQNALGRGGMSVDVVAELWGFESPEEMVLELAKTKGGLKAAVDAQTQARVQEALGEEFVPPGEVQESPSEQDAFQELLETEERILAAKSGQAPLPSTVLRAMARRLVAEKPIRELYPAGYKVTASRQALLAIGASQQGRDQEALVAKRREMLNRFMEIEARKARDQAVKDVKGIQRYEKLPAQKRLGLADKEGKDFQEQVNAILERFEFKVSLTKQQQARSLVKLIDELEAENGDVVVIPDWVREENVNLSLRTHWRNLTPSELSDVRNSLDNLSELANQEHEMMVGADRLDRAEIQAKLDEEARANVLRPAKQVEHATMSRLERARSVVRGLESGIVQIEWLIDFLGGNNPNSMWRRAIWNPLSDALDQLNTRWGSYGLRLNDMMQEHQKQAKARGLDYSVVVNESRLTDPETGKPIRMTRWNLIMIGMNLGNASNMDKLLRGYGWDKSLGLDGVMEILREHLQDEDWVFIQQSWDLIHELWPEIAAMERRVTGVAPPKIQAQKLFVHDGLTLDGGYFPVVYDPTRSNLGARNLAKNILDQQGSPITSSTTAHGFTESRTKVAKPILLETSVISHHLYEVLLDLTHREALKKVVRLLRTDEMAKTLRDTLGNEYSFENFWVPWLNSIKGQRNDSTPAKLYMKAYNTLRINMTIFKLGGRLTTLLMQVGGHFNGYETLRRSMPGVSSTKVAQYWLNGVLTSMKDVSVVYGQDASVANGVMDSSSFMRARVKNWHRDAREVIQRAQVGQGWSDEVAEFAMGLIGQVQFRTVDIPIWLAARQMAINGLQENIAAGDEVAARRFADSQVRKSQGSGEAISLSELLRSNNALLKTFTMFYSYNNTVYQQLRFSQRALVVGISSVPSFLSAYLFYVVLPEMFAEAVRGTVRALTGPEPEELDEERERARLMSKAADILVGGAAGSLPWVRDGYQTFVGTFIDPSQGYRFKTPGAVGMGMEEVAKVSRAIKSDDGRLMMLAALRASSVARGLPLDWLISLAERSVKEDNR